MRCVYVNDYNIGPDIDVEYFPGQMKVGNRLQAMKNTR